MKTEYKVVFWIVISFLVIGTFFYLNDKGVFAATNPDPNCTVISEVPPVKTYYCYNPENGKNYYRNNLGFMMLDKEE